MPWCQECLLKQGEMPEVWRFYTHWRFPVSNKEISVQVLPQVWILYKLMLSKNKLPSSLGNQRPTCYRWEMYMLVRSPYAAIQKICPLAMSPFACNSGYSAHKLIVSRFPHHPTWLQTLHIGWNHTIQETSSSGKDWTLAQMSISCQLVYTSWCLMIQSWRSLLLVHWRLILILLIHWRLWGLVYSIWSTKTLRNYMKWHFMLHRMMVVSCCPAPQHLCLDWYNLTQD